jgi:alanine dehydrogenase
VLAIMDSIEITTRRTAAASVLAARYLARPEADTIAICGCGEQGRAHLTALASARPVARAWAWDIDADKALCFAREMTSSLGILVAPVTAVEVATRASDVIVTATTARTPFLTCADVPAGAFVAAVGADSPDKCELAPDLVANAKVVVDLLAQSAVMGDLHHAIEAGCATPSDVYAELGELVAGRKPGRVRPDEVTVFDSTGIAVADVASAVWIHRRALARRVGSPINLNAP